MLSYTRVVRFKNVGSMISAMPVCLQIVEHFKKTYKIEAHLMTPMLGGHPARALFVFQSDALATMQDVLAKSAQDKEYVGMVMKLGEFVDGSATNDQTWQTVV